MDTHQYEALFGEKQISLDAKTVAQLDATPLGNGHFHVLKDKKSYNCQILSIDQQTKEITVKVNRNKYQFVLKDAYDQLVKEMGLSVVINQLGGDILAPMPGLILDILVEDGQTVEKGTPLLILEAMKMENIIKADGPGTVHSIRIAKGAAVEKKQLLIEMA